MSDILQRIVEVKRDEIAAARPKRSAADLQDIARTQSAPRGFAAAMRAHIGLVRGEYELYAVSV